MLNNFDINNDEDYNLYRITLIDGGIGAEINGSGETILGELVLYSDTGTVSVDAGIRDGFTFDRWEVCGNFTSANLELESDTDIACSATFNMPESNITLIAIWVCDDCAEEYSYCTCGSSNNS